MEAVFAFFLESSFLGLFLFGEKRLGPRLHWAAAFLVFLGSWLSGYFIIATNAWMQHPVGYRVTSSGAIELESFRSLLSNPWLAWQYPHNMSAAVITASIVMSATGAFYLLTGHAPGACANLHSYRRHRGCHRVVPDDLAAWRWPGSQRRRLSAGDSLSHGGALPY
jgi:cytochrome bd-type quinol oxidase subunit 1